MVKAIVGFSNQWYSQALQFATVSEIAEGVTTSLTTSIKLFSSLNRAPGTHWL